MPQYGALYPVFIFRENAKGFFALVESFSNWYSYLPFEAGISSKVVLLCRGESGARTITIDKRSKMMEIDFDGRIVKFYFSTKRQLVNNLRNIYQTFLKEQYGTLDVKGREVVDIGTNNGDSAMFFAIKGAKKVYAYEPYPFAYELAKHNIALNKMQKQIVLNNQAVLKSRSSMRIATDYESTSNSMLEKSSKGRRILILGLDDIVKKYNLRHAILKMDCEGSEYDIFLNASDAAIKSFDQIGMEYHFGYESLEKRFKKLGYKVNHTQPKVTGNAETNGLKMRFGMLYAKR